VKSIILPMYESKLNTYNVYCALFSIIAKDESYLPWFYSNFISIGINTCDDTLYFTDHFSLFEYGDGLTSCPWLEVYKPPHKTIYSHYKFNIKDVLISYLNQNKYVWLYLDQYYIPKSSHYFKMHKEHSVLVCGFDDEKKIFYIADNLDHGKFIKETITYKQLVSAWESDLCEHFRRLFRVIHRTEAEYKLDIALIKRQLEDYLSSRSVTDGIYWDQVPVDGPHAYVQNRKYWIFGHDVYKYILQLLSEAAKESLKRDIDLRIFHLLWEHKKCMMERMDHLGFGLQDCYKEYEKVVHESFVIRNLVLKYNFSKNESILDKINKKIRDVVHIEERTFRNMIESL